MTGFKRLRLVELLALALLSGCSARLYTPRDSRPFEPITEFSSTSSVSLQNGQPSSEQVIVVSRALARDLSGNLNAWTNVAIEMASHQLKLRGLKVVSGAPKTITMSIQSANTTIGFAKIETDISMAVKTSDGYSSTYVGRNSSAMVANLPRQIDGA